VLNVHGRSFFNHAITPLGQWLARRNVSPDAITLLGTVGSVAACLIFFTQGWWFTGTMIVWAFVMLDVVDGAVARASGRASKFGAVLDSTCDRVADGALFAGLTWWCLGVGEARVLGVAALTCLVAGQLTSYIKARAEGVGLAADGGLVERAERLLIGLVGAGLQGLGVPYALHVALWALAAGSIWTVGQRIVSVYRSARAAGAPGPVGPVEPVDGP
jgi:CDP-diacylglycerol--glycerol-3-phosphate 3-phosphatidyltransferase